MASNSQWVTMEGGITNTFPLSINQSAYWTALRRGECFEQDMAERNRRGILRYQSAPAESPQFFIKDFVPEIADTKRQVLGVFHYGRWWRVDLNDPRSLQYSELGITEENFSLDVFTNGILFSDDGDTPIRLIAFSGDGTVFVLKETCAYTLSSANQNPSVWRKSAPEYSMGTTHQGPSVSNPFFDDKVFSVWNGGGSHGNRHFMWSGRGLSIEISEDVREISEAETAATVARVNWSQQLVLIGSLCYDLNARRIFRYTGAATASYTSRPFYDPQFRVQTLYKLVFITSGEEGSADIAVEYGSNLDAIKVTKTAKIVCRASTSNRFRHMITFDLPILCRIWRIKVSNLTGFGIVQIDARIGINQNSAHEDQP
jgi:hypothetical protein